jgi:hypothetical protein
VLPPGGRGAHPRNGFGVGLHRISHAASTPANSASMRAGIKMYAASGMEMDH